MKLRNKSVNKDVKDKPKRFKSCNFSKELIKNLFYDPTTLFYLSFIHIFDFYDI